MIPDSLNSTMVGFFNDKIKCMMRLVEIELDEAAVTYVESSLGENSALTRYILENSGKWKFSAVAPQGTSANRLKDFEVGSLCSAAESRRWLVQFCGEGLKKFGPATFVLEDVYAKPSDIQGKPPHGIEVLVSRGKVFYLAKIVPGHADLILDVLRCPLSFRTISLIVVGQIDMDNFQYMASIVQYLVVTAYDQESFLIGRPSSAIPSA